MFEEGMSLGGATALNLLHAVRPAPTLIPVALESVQAGFPSPAQDYWSGDLDLEDHLIRDKAATFIVRAAGHSMTGAGIHDGDALIVDRGVRPAHGRIVIAIVDGELTVKTMLVGPAGVILHAENPDYSDVEIPELSELTIWGVVTWVLHRTPH